MQVMLMVIMLALLGSVRIGTEANPANANSNQGGQVDSTDRTSPIPLEFQVECGSVGPCDGRTHFCSTEAFLTCEKCTTNMCAFGNRKEDYNAIMKQCEHHCPVFAEKLAAEKYCGTCAERCSIPSTITTTTSSETTSSYDCADEIAMKDHKIHSLQSQLASKDTTLIRLASYAGLVTVGLLAVIIVILCGHRLKATFCSAKNPPTANPAKSEEGLLEAHENDDVDEGSSNGENGNQPSEEEIPGARGVDRANGTVPKFPDQTAQPEHPFT